MPADCGSLRQRDGRRRGAPRDRAKVVPLVALFRVIGARAFLVRAVTDALVLPTASQAVKEHVAAAPAARRATRCTARCAR